MANPCCDPYSDLIYRIGECICEDIKRAYPYSSQAINMFELSGIDSGGGALGQTGQPANPNVSTQPTLPSDLNQKVDSEKPTESSIVKPGISTIRSVWEVMTEEGDDVGSRFFNEIHQNPKDPHLTLGFGHFANGTASGFLRSIPNKIRNRVLEELSILLRNDNDYLNQFRCDYFDLFPSEVTFDVNRLPDYLKSFFSSTGALSEEKKTVLYVEHEGICRWADGRIKKYAENHDFSQFIYYKKANEAVFEHI